MGDSLKDILFDNPDMAIPYVSPNNIEKILAPKKNTPKSKVMYLFILNQMDLQSNQLLRR
jgi:hypothetical protein